MNKKLGRLLQPTMGGYMIVMIAFTLATAVFGNYILAAAELLVTAAVLLLYRMNRLSRRKKLQEFVQRHLDEMSGTDGVKPPFPVLVLRLSDGGVVYTNDAFVKLTGFQDTMAERSVTDLLPGFSTEWISSGKTEYAYDVTIENRRYRVYGSAILADDPGKTHLGVLYFADLTELYQVRDEYVRSRPVVSIILVDNYEELTKNLSEGATSAILLFYIFKKR